MTAATFTAGEYCAIALVSFLVLLFAVLLCVGIHAIVTTWIQRRRTRAWHTEWRTYIDRLHDHGPDHHHTFRAPKL